eukprot:gene22695-biopygen23759
MPAFWKLYRGRFRARAGCDWPRSVSYLWRAAPCPPGRNGSGRGPNAGPTIEFKETDADRTRAWPFLPGRNGAPCPARVRSNSISLKFYRAARVRIRLRFSLWPVMARPAPVLGRWVATNRRRSNRGSSQN